MIKNNPNYAWWLLTLTAVFLVLDIFLWYQVLRDGGGPEDKLVFLDVGQGDSELLKIAHGPKILFDAGPVKKLTAALDRNTNNGDRYLDAVFITHPESDHMGGLLDALDYYEIGVVFYNGSEPSDTAKDLWQAILNKLKNKNIPIIDVRRGDTLSYENKKIEIVSPDDNWKYSAAPNDSGLVAKISINNHAILLTADIDTELEKYLMKLQTDLRADVLKLPHHGSKTGLSSDFYRAVNPGAIMIEVGAGNKYGHPNPEVLDSLSKILPNARIYRTDKNGDIALSILPGFLTVTVSRR